MSVTNQDWNRKINNIIEDSKRIMRNSKKKENKPITPKQHPTLKPPSLFFSNTHQNQLNESQILRSILSNTKDKLLEGFTREQKKIITSQFEKMMKKLKIKLASPVKISEPSRKTQTKTQRFQFFEPQHTCKETIRKNATTQRKEINIKSPRNKIKVIEKQSNILSPKKSTRLHTSQLTLKQHRKTTITSPRKTKKSIKIDKLNSPSKKQRKTKHMKNNQADDTMCNYVLIGQNFVEVNRNQLKEMESEIMLQQSVCQEDQSREFMWKEFMDEKQKLSQQRVMSSNKDKNQKFPQNILVKSKQNKKQTLQITQYEISYEKQDEKYVKNLHQQFYSSQNFSQQNQNQNIFKFPQKQQALDLQSLQSQNSLGNIQINDPLQQSKIGLQENSIQIQTNAIHFQLKTNQQILTKLFECSKIDKLQFQQYMDLSIEIYDQEMTEIQRIKDAIEKNEMKIQRLIKNTKSNLKLVEKIEDMDASNILEEVFGQYKKKHEMVFETPTKGQNQQNNGTNQEINNFEEIEKYTLQSSRVAYINSPQKSQTSQSSISQQKIESPNKNKIQQIESYQKFQQDISDDGKMSMKTLMEKRMGSQLGIIPNQINQGINTSVASIFQFIKNFCAFLKVYHLQEFLAFVNMPYGYCVKQRLLYMQGYDDDQDQKDQTQNGIIYGIEEVINPNLLENFHDIYYKNGTNSKNPYKSYEKIHHKAIFDALNEAINLFRPYFVINGPPYPWTSSQKSLTYYYIRQDCVQQLLQKVQFQVLKWSSSCCGLIIPQANRHTQQINSDHLSIEQIFEKYTLQTDCELLEQRQSKIAKQQKIQINEMYYQWLFHDQFKTALLYEASSYILEDLTIEISIEINAKESRQYMAELYRECGLSESQIQF